MQAYFEKIFKNFFIPRKALNTGGFEPLPTHRLEVLIRLPEDRIYKIRLRNNC